MSGLVELQHKRREVSEALHDLQAVLEVYRSKRRKLQQLIIGTFPTREAKESRYGDQAVARYVRDDTGTRAELHCMWDELRREYKQPRDEYAELESEHSYLNRLIIEIETAAKESKQTKQRKPAQMNLFGKM